MICKKTLKTPMQHIHIYMCVYLHRHQAMQFTIPVIIFYVCILHMITSSEVHYTDFYCTYIFFIWLVKSLIHRSCV